MSDENNRKPMRLKFGVIAAILLLLVWVVLPIVLPQQTIVGILAGLVLAIVILVWWAFFSRAPRGERWAILLWMAVAAVATRTIPGILDRSVATGHMGLTFILYAPPALALVLVAGVLAGRRLSTPQRRATIAGAILLACASFALLRTDGVYGEGQSQFTWRWSPTAEEKLLATALPEPAAPPAPAAPPKEEPRPAEPVPAPEAAKKAEPAPAPVETPVEWPGFRGPQRDGVVAGLRIKTDWAATPPMPLWRRPVGPGWSSFAVGGGRVYTQEQRGDHEVVAAYNARTGEPIWAHRDATRFYESNGGAGPRGTPTLDHGRVYTLGATGIVNALDAKTGAVVWTRNVAADTGAKMPIWAFSGSPLVVDDLVVVSASSRLAAYDRATGTPTWHTKDTGGSYSSPHLVTLDGVAQIVLLNWNGAVSVAPADGKLLWKHDWQGTAIQQPALTGDGGLLISTGDAAGGLGTRRLAVTRTGDAWKADEVWTSRGLKPYFNDLVVHNGHAYGFDGSILSCIDLKDGQRKWKGGRYGHGQMLLLRDQDALVLLSEDGDIALVSAKPDQYTEISKIPAMNDKTWNHPAIAGDVLYVRNGQEIIAFKLPTAGTN
jgi:outer membrane protein assembly factor BamB